MGDNIKIRIATSADHDGIWSIIKQVITKGNTYVFDPSSSREKMLKYWCGDDKHTYVALAVNSIVGTYFIKDNQPDLGSHVANAAYMTDPNYQGKGVGTVMGLHSLREAQHLGYRAMQFNIVVKSNENAIRLWKKLGFKIVGEVPEAFNDINSGYTNAYIMWRKL